jgi:hypothetical protein
MIADEIEEDRQISEFLGRVGARIGRPLAISICFMVTLPILGFSIPRSAAVALLALAASTFHFGRRSLQILAVICSLYAVLVILDVAPTPPEIKGFLTTYLAAAADCRLPHRME